MTTTATHAPVDPSRTTGTDTNATTTSPRKSGLYDDAFAYGPHLASTGVTFDVISVDAPSVWPHCGCCASARYRSAR